METASDVISSWDLAVVSYILLRCRLRISALYQSATGVSSIDSGFPAAKFLDCKSVKDKGAADARSSSQEFPYSIASYLCPISAAKLLIFCQVAVVSPRT